MDGVVSSVVIGLLTGFLSGIISGIVVTKYYRMKDEKKDRVEKKEQSFSIVAKYFEDIMAEIELLENGTTADRGTLLRLLKNRKIRHKELKDVIYDNEQEYVNIVSTLVKLERRYEISEIDASVLKSEIGKISMALLKYV